MYLHVYCPGFVCLIYYSAREALELSEIDIEKTVSSIETTVNNPGDASYQIINDSVVICREDVSDGNSSLDQVRPVMMILSSPIQGKLRLCIILVLCVYKA